MNDIDVIQGQFFEETSCVDGIDVAHIDFLGKATEWPSLILKNEDIKYFQDKQRFDNVFGFLRPHCNGMYIKINTFS
jgi:hypothetical protein